MVAICLLFAYKKSPSLYHSDLFSTINAHTSVSLQRRSPEHCRKLSLCVCERRGELTLEKPYRLWTCLCNSIGQIVSVYWGKSTVYNRTTSEWPPVKHNLKNCVPRYIADPMWCHGNDKAAAAMFEFSWQQWYDVRQRIVLGKLRWVRRSASILLLGRIKILDPGASLVAYVLYGFFAGTVVNLGVLGWYFTRTVTEIGAQPVRGGGDRVVTSSPRYRTLQNVGVFFFQLQE